MKKIRIVIMIMAAITVCGWASTQAHAKDYGFKKSYTISVGRMDVLDFPRAMKTDIPYTYKFSNQKVVKELDDNGWCYGIKNVRPALRLLGKKVGKTKVTAYYQGKKIGSFQVKVEKNNQPELRKNGKKVVLKCFSINGKKDYTSDSYLYVHCSPEVPEQYVAHRKEGATYFFKKCKSQSFSIGKKHDYIRAEKTGKVKVMLCERYKGKVKNVGRMTVISKEGRLGEVVQDRLYFFDDGLFGYGEYTEYLKPNGADSLNMKAKIVKELLKYFKPSDYSIQYFTSDANCAKFSQDGILTGGVAGRTKISYVITMKDGYQIKDKFDVVVEDSTI